MAVKESTQINNTSYVSDYIKAFNSQYGHGQNFLLSPQLLNTHLKNINMNGVDHVTQEDIERMITAPHLFEEQLRRLSFKFYNEIPIYRKYIELCSAILDFDWEPIPYLEDGTPMTSADFNSRKFKKDYAIMTQFFNKFNVKAEFPKVVWNMCLYDTYYTSIREYDNHIYLQELPAQYSQIDATSYLGYMFSFDVSYFTNVGVDINSYSPDLRRKYNNALQSNDLNYNPNLPQRNGSWVYWYPMVPDDSWVFKYNKGFAGSVPPVLGMLSDYNKTGKFKDLEEIKKELEAYKVIFASVPRMKTGKMGNKQDDFAISATELGKFVATVKDSLKVDFKAAPLEDFKAFDFSPSASEADLLATEVSNMMKETGLADAVLIGGNSVSSNNLYKETLSAILKELYPQFSAFCEYQINKNTEKYKFKIKFVGTIFDREDRRKTSNEDMERGIITPSIFSARGIQLTDVNNMMGFMNYLGIPNKFTPIKTASTMSSKEKESVGRTRKSESSLTDSGEQTRDIAANEAKGET
jgi:hypothetical protein